MLYYRHEEEKDQHPKAPELDRSLRALSSRWSDEGSQEGSQQEGMPRKGARMKVGDLVRWKPSWVTDIDQVGLMLEMISDDTIVGDRFWGVQWTDGTRDSIREPMLEVINESR